MISIAGQVIVLVTIVAAVARAGPTGPAAENLREQCRAAANAEPAADVGVMLAIAGTYLDDADLKAAADKWAHALAATQKDKGQFPPETDDAVSTRAATAGPLAMICLVLDGQEDKDARLVETAENAARFLQRRQHMNGGWPRIEDQKKKTQIFRFDDRDWRDSTFALQVHFLVTGNADSRQAAEKAMNELNNCATNPGNDFLPGARLWPTRRGLKDIVGQDPSKEVADLLASRYAVQTYLGIYSAGGTESFLNDLKRAGERIAQLAADGKWVRYASMGVADPDWPTGDWGLQPVLATIRRAKALSQDLYVEKVNAVLSPKEQLAVSIVRLTDQPFVLDPAVWLREADSADTPAGKLWKAFLEARFGAGN